LEIETTTWKDIHIEKTISTTLFTQEDKDIYLNAKYRLNSK